VNQCPTHVDHEKPRQPQDDQDDSESPEHSYLLSPSFSYEHRKPVLGKHGTSGLYLQWSRSLLGMALSPDGLTAACTESVACAETGCRVSNSRSARMLQILTGSLSV
jgi:hypothetical protein